MIRAYVFPLAGVLARGRIALPLDAVEGGVLTRVRVHLQTPGAEFTGRVRVNGAPVLTFVMPAGETILDVPDLTIPIAMNDALSTNLRDAGAPGTEGRDLVV